MTQKVHRLHDDLPFDDELEDLVANIALGENIEALLSDVTSPLSMMVAAAREEFVTSTLSLLDADQVDLSTPEGVKQARSLQSKAHRYLMMCRWMTEAHMAAGDAEDIIKIATVEEGEAIEQLKEQTYGKRAKPAHDA